MQHSDSLSNLAAALNTVQAALKAVPKTHSNPFTESKFADLSEIIEASKSPLAQNGLAIVQLPVSDDAGRIGLETMLLHTSGEWLCDRIVVPIPEEKKKSAAQNVGSVLTYFRRYARAAVLGIAEEPDTDGNGSGKESALRSSASIGASRQQVAPRTARPTRQGTPQPLSPVQRAKLIELYRALSGSDESAAIGGLNAIFVEAYKHDMAAAFYEEGARITGQLLADLRSKKYTAESAAPKSNGALAGESSSHPQDPVKTGRAELASKVCSRLDELRTAKRAAYEKDHVGGDAARPKLEKIVAGQIALLSFSKDAEFVAQFIDDHFGTLEDRVVSLAGLDPADLSAFRDWLRDPDTEKYIANWFEAKVKA